MANGWGMFHHILYICRYIEETLISFTTCRLPKYAAKGKRGKRLKESQVVDNIVSGARPGMDPAIFAEIDTGLDVMSMLMGMKHRPAPPSAPGTRRPGMPSSKGWPGSTKRSAIFFAGRVFGKSSWVGPRFRFRRLWSSPPAWFRRPVWRRRFYLCR